MSDDNSNKPLDTVSPAMPDDVGETEQDTAPKSPPAASTSASSGRSGGGLAIFLSLVAIGIASYPAYLAWQSTQQATQQAAEPDPLTAQVQQITQDQVALNASLARLETLLPEQGAADQYTDQQLASLESRLMNEIGTIREQLGTSSQDWLYAEVEYLVRMANQRALMERDVSSALTLLSAADEIVREAEGLTAHALREALARDMAKLKAVNEPDVQGIFLELSALVAQVPMLQRSLPTFTAVAAPPTDEQPPGGWMDRMVGLVSDAGTRLATLVDFRRGDVEIKPILPPQEEYYLRQNLVLKLQMAQLALLEGNNDVFRSTVAQASAWVREHFDADDAATIAMVQTLDALAGANVAVDIPDISGSLTAVRRQLENFKGETSR